MSHLFVHTAILSLTSPEYPLTSKSSFLNFSSSSSAYTGCPFSPGRLNRAYCIEDLINTQNVIHNLCTYPIAHLFPLNISIVVEVNFRFEIMFSPPIGSQWLWCDKLVVKQLIKELIKSSTVKCFTHLNVDKITSYGNWIIIWLYKLMYRHDQQEDCKTNYAYNIE